MSTQTHWQIPLARMLEHDADHHAAQLGPAIRTAFLDLASDCAATYLTLTDEYGNAKAFALPWPVERLVTAILDAVRARSWAGRTLADRWRRHYRTVGRRTVATLNEALELDLRPSEGALNDLGHAGTRAAHLLDVTADTRTAIVRAIRDGTDAGDNPITVARRIRAEVPKGRFVKAGARYRAELIARTETLAAQRIASLDAYENSPVIAGARAADGDSDEECRERDGRVFSIMEARAIRTHPNCVLTWLPALIEP